MSEIASSLPEPLPGLPAARGDAAARRQPAAQHLRAALPADGARRDADRPGDRHDPAASAEAGRRRRPELYRTGCAGRITNFSETDDGRFLITLTGVCRFDVAEELDGRHPLSPGRGRLRPLAAGPAAEPAAGRAEGEPARGAARPISSGTASRPTGARSRARRWPGWSPRLCMICPFEPEREAGAARGRRHRPAGAAADRADADGGAGRARRLQRPALSEPSHGRASADDRADRRGRPRPAPARAAGLPADQGPLRYDRERNELVSEQAGLAYPIRDGIPIMLVDEARPLDDERVRAARGPRR